MSRVLLCPGPHQVLPNPPAFPLRSGGFLVCARSLSESGRVAAALMPRVRHRSEAVNIDHGQLVYPSLGRRRDRPPSRGRADAGVLAAGLKPDAASRSHSISARKIFVSALTARGRSASMPRRRLGTEITHCRPGSAVSGPEDGARSSRAALRAAHQLESGCGGAIGRAILRP